MDIKLKNVSVGFDEKKVLENFSATFSSGEITCVLGASGVGKTTLLNVISGGVDYSGKVEKDDNGISYIFQDERLIESISVYKNLDLILKSKIKSKAERKIAVLEMLDAVELGGERDSFPKQLSGGMAQRVAIARGFIFPSEILLMDEAFKGLDVALKQRLISVFISLFTRYKKTVVFVTHSIDEALLLAHRVIVVEGSPAKISLDERISAPQSERKLTDESLDLVRKKLLAAVSK